MSEFFKVKKCYQIWKLTRDIFCKNAQNNIASDEFDLLRPESLVRLLFEDFSLLCTAVSNLFLSPFTKSPRASVVKIFARK